MLYNFSCVYWIYIYTFFLWCISSNICPFKNWVVFLLLSYIYMSFTTFMYYKYFLLVNDLTFHFFNGIFWKAIFTFDEVTLSIFSFKIGAFFYPKKSLPTPRLEIFSPMFYSRSFVVLVFIFMFIIYLALIFIYSVRQELRIFHTYI